MHLTAIPARLSARRNNDLPLCIRDAPEPAKTNRTTHANLLMDYPFAEQPGSRWCYLELQQESGKSTQEEAQPSSTPESRFDVRRYMDLFLSIYQHVVDGSRPCQFRPPESERLTVKLYRRKTAPDSRCSYSRSGNSLGGHTETRRLPSCSSPDRTASL